MAKFACSDLAKLPTFSHHGWMYVWSRFGINFLTHLQNLASASKIYSLK